MENDLSESHWSRIREIFRKYENGLRLSQGLKIGHLETELRKEFGLHHQQVKDIVCTLWENGEFESVCNAIAESAPCTEYDLLRLKRKGV